MACSRTAKCCCCCWCFLITLAILCIGCLIYFWWSVQVDPVIGKSIVEEINKEQSDWTAKYHKYGEGARMLRDKHWWDFLNPFYPSYDDAAVARSRLDAFRVAKNYINESEKHVTDLLNLDLLLPQTFDARIKWPFCWSIHSISNQGSCGNCWAQSAADVISDRFCIASEGKLQPSISVEDLTSCCEPCSHEGCGGGISIMNAFDYWLAKGVVTGGPYGSNSGCKPFSVAPACGDLPCPQKMYGETTVTECKMECQEHYYDKSYAEDKNFASKIYALNINTVINRISDLDSFPPKPANESEEIIKRELMTNGPVVYCFEAMDDLQFYDSGIYHHVKGSVLYGHCVRLIGWGENYWIIANSWGRTWGEYGYLRVRDLGFGTDSVEFVAGIPKI